MKNLSKKNIVIGFVLLSAVSFLVFGNVGNVADNESLRTQIRYNADTLGVVLTDVWTRVESDRQMVIMGGTLTSTQQLYTLFYSITNFNNFIFQVQQTITTPEGNPYPQFFSVGFNPSATKKKKDNGKGKSKIKPSIQPETIQRQPRQQETENKQDDKKFINFLDQ